MFINPLFIGFKFPFFQESLLMAGWPLLPQKHHLGWPRRNKSVEQCSKTPDWWDNRFLYPIPWRIHGAGIYANMTGVYWLDPWSTIYSSTMDPSWESMGYGLPICFPRFSKGNFTAQRLVPRPRDVSSFPQPCETWSLKTWQCLSHDIGWSPW